MGCAANKALASASCAASASQCISRTSAVFSDASSRWSRHRSCKPATDSAGDGVGPSRTAPAAAGLEALSNADASLCVLSRIPTSAWNRRISSCRLSSTRCSASACATRVRAGRSGNASASGPKRASSAMTMHREPPASDVLVRASNATVSKFQAWDEKSIEANHRGSSRNFFKPLRTLRNFLQSSARRAQPSRAALVTPPVRDGAGVRGAHRQAALRPAGLAGRAVQAALRRCVPDAVQNEADTTERRAHLRFSRASTRVLSPTRSSSSV